ncbi:MAG TPA: peptide-methionine (R)-S-oxide reductase [Candidatus Yonathbacteria bacterium]|nr:peptide-methionine (R)-S-oxide reductase [Candidatus Yonathbacteria bacterium]
MDTSKTEIAVFGGGCFWCTEAVFKMFRGVLSVAPGYAGGSVNSPTYDQVCAGDTGHAEVIRIEYYPALVSFETLLTIFFASHDATTLNRQGNDVGTQYRSVIFYTTDQQKSEASGFIKKLNDSTKSGAPVVTEVSPLNIFYPAEDYHKNYYEQNGNNVYCKIIISPKLQKVQEKFAELLTSKSLRPRREFGNSDSADSKMTNNNIPTTEKEWREKLSHEQYRVLREKGTEAPFSGKLLHVDKDGIYKCSACGNPLFASGAKFDSGTGWPSFDESIPGAVRLNEDTTIGGVQDVNLLIQNRTEVVCAKCGSHLGHLFNDGPTETHKRYCMNSVCLDLEAK